MTLLVDDIYLDKLIQNQRRTIRVYVAFTLTLTGLGIVILIFATIISSWLSANVSIPEDVLKGLMQISGGFVMSLGAFPYKEISNRNDKIHAFEIMKEKLRLLNNTPKSKRAKSEEQLEELSWKILEKMALS